MSKVYLTKIRSESTFQSIDESMVKFKGRSVMKQYLPLKPIKRGIKIWERCDSEAGFVYDLDIYSGKEEGSQQGTLGERVVKKLSASIRDSEVQLCFDRFFTSVILMKDLPFAAVGTCMTNRKDMPNFQIKKMSKGERQALFSDLGIAAYLWKDTKDVVVLSNCHSNETSLLQRKQKDGKKVDLQCPEAIKSYNTYMGGVDLSDQLSSLYEIDRKSQKWWRKVFYKLLLTTATNAWIVFKETRRKNIPFITFLVKAEDLIATERKNASVIRKRSSGRPSNASRHLVNVGDHLPYQGATGRRCHPCTQKGIEKRTKSLCSACNFPICKDCFYVFHK